MPRPLSESSIVAPTPSDIDIAQSVEPLPITDVAEVLFEARQLELYGACKAKVKISEVLVVRTLRGRTSMTGTSVCLSVCLGGLGVCRRYTCRLSVGLCGSLWGAARPIETSYGYRGEEMRR